MPVIIKITGSIFIISFFVGILFINNKEWRDFFTNLMIVTAGIFLLSLIWGF